MNLYEELGVLPDADDDTIKRAYRKKAMQHHPDREGGDKAAFQKIEEAMRVLSDPVRRARYDATGETGELPSLDVEAVNNLAELVLKMIDRGNVETRDLIAAVRADIDEAIAQVQQLIANVKKKIANRTKALERLSVKSNGPNQIADRVRAAIGADEAQLSNYDKALMLTNRMKELLADYTWRVDERKPMNARDQEIADLFALQFGRKFGI